jgi:serpin B
MHVRSNFRYTEIDQFQVLELPYAGNDSSMIVMLPARGAGNHATSQTLRSVNDWLATSDAKTEVDVSLPKFKNTVTSSLSELLPGMGMPRAFDPEMADLTA